MYERMQVCDPLFIELPDPAVPKLLFVTIDDPPERGTVERTSTDGVAQHFPWFTEMLLQLRDRSGERVPLHICIYRIPINDELDLHAACIDSAPELLLSILGGADYGDAMALKVAKHWPDVYSMLEASTAANLGRRSLIAFDSRHGRQWLVADPVVGEARGWFNPEAIFALGMEALEVALRVNDVLTTLPEILDLGPDLTSRRLKALGGLFSGVGGAGGDAMTLAGGELDFDAMRSLFETARDIPDQVRAAMERRQP